MCATKRRPISSDARQKSLCLCCEFNFAAAALQTYKGEPPMVRNRILPILHSLNFKLFTELSKMMSFQ